MYSTFDIIVKPLIGAVIGYATNKIAIKMLFRPYTEKKILGLRLPFTPGVIPRERSRIASSLGEAVGENLLTTEALEKELLSDEIMSKIKAFILDDKLAKDFSLDEGMDYIFGENSRDIKERIFDYICDEIYNFANRSETRENIRGIFSDYIIKKVGYNEKISRLFTDGIKAEVLDLIVNNKEELLAYLIEVIRKEKVKNKISEEISSIVSMNFGPLGAMFVDSGNVSDLVVEKIERTIRDDEVFEEVLAAISKGMDDFREKTVCSVVSVGVFEKYLNEISLTLVEEVYKNITYKNVVRIVEPIFVQTLARKIHLNSGDKEEIERAFESMYTDFVKNNLAGFLQMIDVSKLVEKEINSFSVEEMEGLILGIVDKELSAITWFGGLLGFLIGIIYIFI